MSSMRVLHVTRQFLPSIGGLEDVVLNLAQHQRASHGVDARVVTLDSIFADRGTRLPARDEVGGVPVDRIRWWGPTRYPVAPGVLRHALAADLIHVHAIDFFVDFMALTRAIHRRPMVVLTHGGIFHTERQARLKRLWFSTLTRRSLRSYDAVVASSDNDARLFAELDPPGLVTIENGVNVGKLRGGPCARPLRDPRRMLFVGRFAPHKRIGALFALLAALRRQQPGWTLVIAGVEWGETVASLAEQARSAGIGDAVRFVVGAPDDVLADEAAAATWFACASAFEGFGVAAVEAAAAGLVPLLSRIPPFERLLASLPAGLLFDPDAPDGTATAVLALARVHQDRAEQVRAELSRAADRHDWSHVAAHYVRLYERILGGAETRVLELRTAERA